MARWMSDYQKEARIARKGRRRALLWEVEVETRMTYEGKREQKWEFTASVVTCDEYGRNVSGLSPDLHDREAGTNLTRPQDGDLYGLTLWAFAWNHYDHERLEPMGMTAQYRSLYSVDLKRAEVLVKTLKLIEKRQQQFEAVEGVPETVGEWACMMARILGCSTMMTWVERTGRYSDSTYQHTTLREGARLIDASLAEWQETVRQPQYALATLAEG